MIINNEGAQNTSREHVYVIDSLEAADIKGKENSRQRNVGWHYKLFYIKDEIQSHRGLKVKFHYFLLISTKV